MILFFDTETTGLPKNWKAPVSDTSNWPRLVQLAYLMYSETGLQQKAVDFIVKPEGFTIPSDASAIHGITTAKANSTGKPLKTVLEDFKAAVEGATTIIAHNISFDEKIVGAEFYRLQIPNPMYGKKKICTMESTVNFCAISGPYGYKWPKLEELYYKIFRSNFEEQHNAAMDIKATAKCYWELKKMGKI
jgi:DNA polymerase III epsilon subunit-like protein